MWLICLVSILNFCLCCDDWSGEDEFVWKIFFVGEVCFVVEVFLLVLVIVEVVGGVIFVFEVRCEEIC